MRVTKYIHSCLLVEHEETAALIDPGGFSWASIDINSLPKLQAVLITHRHPDHYNAEAIKSLISRFPELSIVTNKEVAELLKEESLTVDNNQYEWLETAKAKHPTPPWKDKGCVNNVFHLFGKLTHPGDSHSFTQTREILALPITAPWGSMMDAVNYAVKMAPRVVIPIHDWHWNEAARQDAYAKAKKVFEANGIQFAALENGVSTEL